jgi:DNA-binding CsgD family transcriptional regulator
MVAATHERPRRLRVLIHGAEGPRRSRLVELVVQAGHDVAARASEADVVLADGDSPAIAGAPVVTVGRAHTDHAGSLDHDATPEQIDAALRAVAAGLVVRSAAGFEGGFAEMREGAVRALLTPREIEVLEAIRQGLTNKMMAKRLEISPHTVKFHVESVFRKLGARSRADAVARALELQRERIEL